MTGNPALIVYRFPPVAGMQFSPFVLKLETWLRMVALPYDTRNLGMRLGPKGKLPYVRYGERIIADSEHIIAFLSRETGLSLETHLDARQRAESVLLRRLLEEHLYFALLHSRWIDAQNWPQFREMAFLAAPAPFRKPVAFAIRRRVAASLHAQGLGRHKGEEIYAKGCEDLAAISAYLQSRPYLLGDTPSQADASAYGMLASIFFAPLESPFKATVRNDVNLSAYMERLRGSVWPEAALAGGDEKRFEGVT